MSLTYAGQEYETAHANGKKDGSDMTPSTTGRVVQEKQKREEKDARARNP
jgi:hypothetical protein